MADENTQESAAEEGAESAAQHTEPTKGDSIPSEVKAALRKANKEAETLRLKLKEFEDRDKNEYQLAVERAEAAERAAAQHETAALRLQVAFDKGLTPAQAKRLVGATREELEADADEVLRDFPAAPPAPSRPRGDVGQGTRSKPLVADPRQQFAAFLGGESA